MNEDKPLSVSELVGAMRSLIESSWPAPITVCGEISNLRRYPSGHAYFTLKDADAEISCVIFSRDLQTRNHGVLPAEGDTTEALVRPAVYEPRGRLQLRVLRIHKRGAGALHERFVALKKQLQEKGWFAPERKRPIPSWPEKVAVVASAEGAAWRDVQTTLAARFPAAQVWLFAAPAQGNEAAARIAAAIMAAADSECDLMLVVRGGGSFEDLWAYNEIEVADAIYRSRLPVIAGIGHETDETIADYVADLRAPTPTGAAVAATPCRDELLKTLATLADRLRSAARDRIETASQQLDEAGGGTVAVAASLVRLSRLRLHAAQSELAASCRQRIGDGRTALEAAAGSLSTQLRIISAGGSSLRLLTRRLNNAIELSSQKAASQAALATRNLAAATAGQLRSQQRRLSEYRLRLQTAGPQQTLERGYAIIAKHDGSVVQRVRQLAVGDRVSALFADGLADTAVTATETGRRPFAGSQTRASRQSRTAPARPRQRSASTRRPPRNRNDDQG